MSLSLCRIHFRFISSQEKDVKIYSMSDGQIETVVRSLDDAVKVFSLSPCGDYLALVNGKGDLLIYRLVSDKGPLGRAYNGSNLVFHQNVLSKSESRNFVEGYRLSWRPSPSSAPSSSPQLCIPQHDGFPLIFSRQANGDDSASSSLNNIGKETWTSDLILTSDAYETTLSHCRQAVNLVAFSPNGKYLASADSTGKILIWDIPTRDAIMAYQCQDTAGIQQTLLDIQWGATPGDNYLIVLGQEGTAKIDNVINTSLGHPLPTGEYVTESPAPLVEVTKAPPVALSTPSRASIVSSLPTSSMKRIKKSMGREEADDEDDLDFTDKTLVSSSLPETVSASRPSLPTSAVKGTVIQDDDDDLDDAGDGALSDDEDDRLEGVDLIDDGFLVDDQSTHKRRSSSILTVPSNQFVQPSFQPSSTTYDEKRRRYLVWNSVGSVVSRDEDIGNRIEIKFADTSGNKNESFNDNYCFELGDLSTQGAIFATVPQDQINLPPPHTVSHLADDEMLGEGGGSGSSKRSAGVGSVLFYKAFSTKIEFGSYANENFLYSLPYREVALCVTASVGWVAVVSRSSSSLHYLRIFTTTGMQLYLSVIKGSVVCLCSHNHHLCVAYNSPGATIQSPALLVDTYHITPVTRSVAARPLPNITSSLSQCMLPLTSHSSLQWLSYSNNSQLVSLDTAGQLLMLFTLSSSSADATTSQWIPILDLNLYKKNIDYNLWPVTVKGDKLCYILLNGEKKPGHHPQPIVTAKPFQLPVLEPAGAASTATQKDKDGIALTERYREYLWHSSLLTHHQHTLEQHLTSGYPLPEIASYTSKEVNTHLLDDTVTENLIGLDKILLKLLYEYCKKQKISMALDVIGRMTTTDALESAIKVANHFSKGSLAVIVSEILNERKRAIAEERSLDGEFEGEFHQGQHHHRDQQPVASSFSSSSSVGGFPTVASASSSARGGGDGEGSMRTGIASFKSSRQQVAQEVEEDDETQQLAQESYNGNQSLHSTQSYEYDFSQQEEGGVHHPHTPEQAAKANRSILSKKPTTGPLFSSTSSKAEEQETKKSIPLNK
jgi:WD40 repeat protein